ncbi:hypothetical protein [Faecalibacterium sp.]|jgi:hypothetical protein|uniref:hypothetical protein n=1 Tax=Faecalibacterium sp. TaxID=1971605 RepID=UPI003527ADF7
MSTYYHTCPHCGASLDPGERCDCTESPRAVYLAYIGKVMQQGRVPSVLRPFCQRALCEPRTPLDTLRTLCTQLKDFAAE